MRTLWAVVLVFLCQAAWPSAASAQIAAPTLFSEASEFLAARGETSPARVRIRYTFIRSRDGGATETQTIILDLADDWSLATLDDRVVLMDFRLGREFHLSASGFAAFSIDAAPAFAMAERQNRTFLAQVLSAAGVSGAGACDATAELSAAAQGVAPPTRVRRTRGVNALECDGREIGRWRNGDHDAPPTFWPTLTRLIGGHPNQWAAMRARNAAPQSIEIVYRVAPDVSERKALTLDGVEAIAAPYPLTQAMANNMAQTLNLNAHGVGDLALGAVRGELAGGAPTLATWGAHVQAVRRDEGAPAAAMLAMITFHMFPDAHAQCASSDQPICAPFAAVRSTMRTDPAVSALFQIADAEQRGDIPAALAAMRSAQASPLRTHPALGASFALALIRGGDAAVQRAQTMGLPHDPSALQTAALRAFPYVPAYWTDAGDTALSSYDFWSAFALYETASAINVPGARADLVQSRISQGRRQALPHFYLAATP